MATAKGTEDSSYVAMALAMQRTLAGAPACSSGLLVLCSLAMAVVAAPPQRNMNRNTVVGALGLDFDSFLSFRRGDTTAVGYAVSPSIAAIIRGAMQTTADNTADTTGDVPPPNCSYHIQENLFGCSSIRCDYCQNFITANNYTFNATCTASGKRGSVPSTFTNATKAVFGALSDLLLNMDANFTHSDCSCGVAVSGSAQRQPVSKIVCSALLAPNFLDR